MGGPGWLLVAEEGWMNHSGHTRSFQRKVPRGSSAWALDISKVKGGARPGVWDCSLACKLDCA